jgi:hypothetical protein
MTSAHRALVHGLREPRDYVSRLAGGDAAVPPVLSS